ncbi:MAG: hypothetical protein IJB68_09730, partial [Ruminococcus sp.]|nr:hypothetical protein [Ruminococcus sp.]
RIGCLSFQQNNTFQHGKKIIFLPVCSLYPVFNSFAIFHFLHIKKVRVDHFHGPLGLLVSLFLQRLFLL